LAELSYQHHNANQHSPLSIALQLRAVLSFLLLLCMRVLNLAVPILYKKLVDSMSDIQAAAGQTNAYFHTGQSNLAM
jgi:hypothetical protein